MAEENLEEKTTKIVHLITDMGNGGAHCGNCYELLEHSRYHSYAHCPKCSYKFIGYETFLNSGGSDF
jgi:uncharacterized CHY-type Zn-finger protein